MMTDPVADMLTRIRNGCQAHKNEVDIPSSKIKHRIAEILKEEGFVEKVEQITAGKKSSIRVHLRYGPKRKEIIVGIRRISKPGLRIYVNHENIPRVLNGLGIAILSTSSGLLTDKQCRQKRVGGEVLCYVW